MRSHVRRAISLCLAVSIFAFGPVHASMSTALQLDINQSGAANFTIPIQVPPGTAGITPRLSITYSNQSGNGLLGVGWSMAGLSTITRCPQTLAQDGKRGRVNYDTNDRFCLDGQRLIAINNGVYGADGTEYRTERERFSKVVSYGSAGNGPAWFKVWTKAGQTMEYGNSSDSRRLAPGKQSARIWALNKLRDAKGNYLAATYNTDAGDGDFYPQQINYTGNDNAATVPNASVRFQYESRPDIRVEYQAGSRITNSVRLSRVQTYDAVTGGALVKEYRLVYGASETTLRSRLANVIECDGAALCLPPLSMQWKPSAATPFPATESNLGELPDTYFARGMGEIVRKGVELGSQMMDVNGDGLPDFIQLFIPTAGEYPVAQRRVLLNTGTGFASSESYAASFSVPDADPYFSKDGKDFGTRVADINGDGLPDLIQLFIPTDGSYDNAPRRRVFINTGTGFAISDSYSASFSVPDVDPYFSKDGRDLGTRIADINGDGLPDLIQLLIPTDGSYSNTPKRRVFLNTGTGFVVSATYSASLAVPGVDPYFSKDGRDFGTRLADINGDGLPDLIQLFFPTDGSYDNVPKRRVLLNTGTEFVPSGSFTTSLSASNANLYFSTNGTDNGTRIADINNDGLPDLIQLYIPLGKGVYGTAEQRRVWLNTGTEFVFSDSYTNSFFVSDVDPYFSKGGRDFGTQMDDLNGDGLPDIVQLFIPTDGSYDNQPKKRVFLNTGTAFVSSEYYSQAVSTTDTYFVMQHPDRFGPSLDFGTRLVDVNGDAIPDIVQMLIATNGAYENQPQRRIFLASNGQPDLLSSIDNGLGTSTSVSYQPITAKDVYTKDTGANAAKFPILDLQIPTYVVSSVTSSNGIGGTQTTNYAYGGLKTEIAGRGLLGYRWMRSTKAETGMSTRTEYRQDWPYIGMPALQTRTLAGSGNGGLLHQATSAAFGCYDFVNSTGCTVSAGRRYFPYVSKTVESNWDLNGSAFPVVTSENQYDVWGNLTQSDVSTSDGYSKKIVNTYTNDTSNWFIGQLLTFTEN